MALRLTIMEVRIEDGKDVDGERTSRDGDMAPLKLMALPTKTRPSLSARRSD